MNQEFKISNLKIIQDEDGYAIMRAVEPGVWKVIATFIYPEDAITYFANTIMQIVAYKQDQIQIKNNFTMEELNMGELNARQEKNS